MSDIHNIAIEQCVLAALMTVQFLNGVCRHEQRLMIQRLEEQFLNGVCRHEHATS